MDNEPQPDAYLRIAPEAGGQARLDEDGYVVGAPELVAEITASSASYDLHDKLRAYWRNGVKEYVVWRVRERGIDWYILRRGQYVKLEPDASGLLRSEVFPGLWLDPAAMIQRDVATVLKRLQEGLASQDHAEFVKRLQSPAKG
jgi:Uma2 family endonuclease